MECSLYGLAFVWSVLSFGQDCSSGPVDCIFSDWEEWTECSHTCGNSGVRERKRDLLLPATCGGACSGDKNEFETCNRHCCCDYSPWSKWDCKGECSNSTEFCDKPGVRFMCHRSRYRIPEVECEGVCEAKTFDKWCSILCCYTTCVVKEWSFWGSCQGQCEQDGVKYRTREVEREPKCGADPCPELTDHIGCRGRCCPVDCVLGDWSVWTECNTTCGIGHKTRMRFVQKPECFGKECPEDPTSTETVECEKYVNEDCTRFLLVSPWSTWSSCGLNNGFCGEGKKTRDRTIITDSKCKGVPCPDLNVTQVCYGKCCRQDCVVSEWTEWSLCSIDCGVGNSPNTINVAVIITRTREVTTQPSCNGSVCPPLSDRQECRVDNKIDCVMAPWTEWSVCNNECGNGTAFRSRKMQTKAYCGGAECADTSLEDEKTCYREVNKDCEILQFIILFTIITKNLTTYKNYTSVVIFFASILILDANANKIPENTQAGTCIGSLQTTDDSYDKHTYSIVNDEKSIFSLHGRKVCLTDTTNYETLPIKYMNYFYSDNGRQHSKLDNNKLMENSPEGTLIGCMEGIDDDPGQSVSLLLVDSDDGLFETYTSDDGKLCLKVKGKSDPLCGTHGGEYCLLNYEKQKIRRITVLATDDGSPPKDAYIDVNIYLQNANDKPVEVKLDPEKVLEEVEPGQPISDLVTVDEDEEQTHTYELLQDTEGIFSIKDGKLLCSRKLDYESESSKEFVIQVVSTIKFKIDDVNEAPFDLQLKSFDSKVNEPTFMIGEISVKDQDGDDLTINVQDTANGRIAYMNKRCKALTDILINGNSTSEIEVPENKNHFKIADLSAEDEDTSATANLDYETQDTYEITILVMDNGNPPMTMQKTFTMKVTNENEAPTLIYLSNDKRQVIGKLTTDDPDNVKTVIQTFTYSLTDDASGRLKIVGDELQVKKSDMMCNGKLCILNYESEPQLNVVVMVTDNGSPPLSYEQKITIYVQDTNDPPEDIRLSRDSIRENEPASTVLGKLSAMDQDVGQSFYFTLVDNQDIFMLAADNTMTTKVPLNHEQKSLYNVTVRCTDNGSPAAFTDAVLTVNVLNVNEVPEYTGQSSLQVSENLQSGTIVGQLIASDVDNDDALTFDIGSSTDFRVSNVKCEATDPSGIECTGDLETTTILDYEVHSTYPLSVTVTDKYGASKTQTVTVIVKDENDDPQNILLNGKSVDVLEVDENIENVKIADLSTDDPDVGQTFTYNIKSGDEGIFEIQGNELKVKSGVEIDYEKKNKYILLLEVTDSGTPPKTLEKTVTINVQNINEAPTSVSLSGNQN
ncbi:hypothetical protein KUTeg_013165 [Tegillarca granosa]|uniref:Cadherin domain-containing protein n=1 Tax=Tegillarca granosa TaxID=220873 RepID=A0ABQ9EWE8_TEGGR|nr:hypothetical protein KUTeg_013165 [Tegillarca granosa]